MAKCSMSGCNNKVVGGFQELIDVGNFQEPNATAPGMITVWCAEHEAELRPTVAGMPGRSLGPQQLQD